MEKNHYLKLPAAASLLCADWESAPEMDEGWLPVLEQIELLARASLSTTVVLVYTTICCVAPL